MEMTSVTIIDLRPIFRRDLPPIVNGGIGRLNFSWYGSSDLSSPNQSRIFSHGFRENVCPRNICPGCTSSTMAIHILGSPVMSNRCSVAFLWHTGVDTLANDD
jgi:hypothetical protein